ncbi:sulfite exporter TauE/SafE family protein [Oleidesulfovibrio sp.]|uniref:sulfite exporter TauE/SafE family protein n=1 Tax=Oleidesulfovibrio sp. TaxID=2909707 RepID=UPI003A850E50
MIASLVLCLVLGAFAGVLAGLLGIGGGLVIVPMLTFSFTWQGVPHEHILHLALGTSMATIIFTSISSMRAHNQRGAVLWYAVKATAPGILVGTFAGAFIASALSTNFLKGFFGCFLLYVAAQMLLDIKPKGTRQLLGSAGMIAAGSGIGVLSSLVGIGGGTLTVPFLTWCNVTIHKAIGTAAAIGFPLAISGALGYVISGWGQPTLPEYSVGYVYLPAMVGIVCASMLTAPVGVRLAHSLPVPRLKRIFAALLIVVGTKMLLSLF